MLRQRIDGDHHHLTEFRHDLHAHPELMYQEERTSAKVQEQLREVGIEFKAGLAGGTGVLAWLPATESGGATVALRADMDALPILEETGLPYASTKPGVMHACGHDGHTAILVGAVRALAAETSRRNNVLFVFQPAEEGGAGGNRLCEEGAMSGGQIGKAVDVIYGLHGWPEAPRGRMLTRNGPLMAATDEFFVKVRGRGGHAAAPHLAIDPVVITAQIITAIQSIASRNVSATDSIIFTVGAIHAGQATNVIPETVEFKGTMRTLTPETRLLGRTRFHDLVRSITEAFGATAEIDWHESYPVTRNDPWATERFRNIARSLHGGDRVHEQPTPVMGGEDFSYYGLHVPACFFFVGMGSPEGNPAPSVHTPRFDFCDDIIPDCVETMCALALSPVDRATA